MIKIKEVDKPFCRVCQSNDFKKMVSQVVKDTLMRAEKRDIELLFCSEHKEKYICAWKAGLV